MNLTYVSKIRLLIIFILVISVIQVSFILHIISQDQMREMQAKIQSTVMITLFFQFVLAMILIFYIPVFLHKAFSEIENLLKDINKGLYSIDIDLSNYSSKLDKNFYGLVVSIKYMLKSVRNFDQLKKKKIIEHHNRINTILKLTEDGFIILDIKGNIVYINENVIEAFPSLSEKNNLIDSSFAPDVENTIKKYVANVIKSRTKQQSQQFFIPAFKRHIVINSGIIRNTEGKTTGAVLAITNLIKKKSAKQEENEEK